MISRHLLFVILILSSAFAHSQHKLQLTITDLRSSEGLVSIELLDKDELTIDGKTAGITGDSCVMIIEGLKDGKYAVRCFHDENSNKELEANWLFELSGDTKIRISTKYF